MWCSHCQSDVRPVISLAGNPPRCSLCGHEFPRTTGLPRPTPGNPPQVPAADTAGLPPGSPSANPHRLSPQELLARWAREETLPPMQLGAGSPGTPASSPPQPPFSPPDIPSRGPAVARLDASHPTSPQPVSLPEQIAAAPPTPPLSAPHFSLGTTPRSHTTAPPAGAPTSPNPWHVPATQPPSRGEEVPEEEFRGVQHRLEGEGPVSYSDQPVRHWHQSHGAVRPPHFPWEPVPAPQRASSTWLAAAQIFVLVGVVGLGTGTIVLLYTHFWATETDTLLPLGYVIAACSQLVLLLGIVQHISLGLEQAEQTMTWRVARLGERLERMEAAASQGGRDGQRSEE